MACLALRRLFVATLAVGARFLALTAAVPPLCRHLPPKADATPKNTCVVAVHGAGRDRRAFMRHFPLFVNAGYAIVAIDCAWPRGVRSLSLPVSLSV